MINPGTTRGRIGLAITWGMTLFGLANLHRLNIGHITSLCGRWGCLAPTAGLLGIHLISLVLVATVAYVVIGFQRISRRHCAGMFLLIGITLTLANFAFVTFKWKPVGLEWVQILPFSLISATDVPAIQLLVVGGFLASKRNKVAGLPDAESQESQPALKSEI